MLEGFVRSDVDVDTEGVGTRIATWTGGDGPPLLLLHGWPQTHHMWHAVAPALAERFTVVLTDLRGYGGSDAPPPTPDHASYSKRAMAADQVGVMAALGFGSFALVGHDRGARVAHRLALDHADLLTRLVLIDIAPTLHVVGHTDLALARAYFHWFLLGAPAPIPESLIGADPQRWVDTVLDSPLGAGVDWHPEARAAYRAAHRRPEVVAATCEDYRAALGIDLEHDEVDRGRRVEVPTLVLWGAEGFVGRTYDVLEIWRDYVTDVRGQALPAGHFVPEQAPTETTTALLAFLASAG